MSMDCKRSRLASEPGTCVPYTSVNVEVDQAEKSLGIETFLRLGVAGFDCILKNRWEDFVVREIKDGHCARLTDLQPLPETQKSLKTVDYEHLISDHLDQLKQCNSDQINGVEIQAPSSKTQRRDMHTAIRTLFPSLISSTIKRGDDSLIIVNKPGVAELQRNKCKLRANVNMAGKKYCRFVLYKEGKDTMTVIQLLCRLLHVNVGAFSYAGTKDRRAITTQYITVKGVNAERLSSLNDRLRGVRVGNFSYVSKPLFLGDLDGNQFVVVLRSVHESGTDVSQKVVDWTSSGFINYYGLQRFGHSAQSRTHEVGKLMMRCAWSQAIDLILMPDMLDHPAVRAIKEEYLKTGNAAVCATRAPISVERTILLGISKYDKTLTALQMLPRNLRHMYLHSYQALIWNRIASRRIREQPPGSQYAKPGDLYFDPSKTCADQDLAIDHASFKHPSVVSVNDLIPLSSVVLPLPGYAVQFPANETMQWYTELLGSDNFTLSNFKHKVKDFALPGAYRYLIVKPENVEITLQNYTDPNLPLIKSDLQLLTDQENNVITTIQDNSQAAKKEMAVILTFSLPKSSYATIAIRELTKSAIEKK